MSAPDPGAGFDPSEITPEIRAEDGGFSGVVTPLKVAKSEYDTTGNKSTGIDQCGNQQTERRGNFGVTIRLSGLLDQIDYERLKRADRNGTTIDLTAQLANGLFEIESFTATRKDGMETGNFVDGDGDLVVSFKLDLKSVSSDSVV